MTHRTTGRARGRRVLAALAAAPLLVATLLLATPAVAVPEGGETAPTDPGGAHVPTPEELAAQRAAAERLAGEVDDAELDLEAARSKVDDLTAKVEAAQESERSAQRAEAAAHSERARQEIRLQAATSLVRSRKSELGRWAAQAYRHGGAMGDIEGFLTLIESDNTDELGQRVQMLDLVGRWRGSVVDTVEEAEAVQADATRKADAAAETAAVAADQAVRARAEADAALRAQQSQVALYGALLRKVRTDADEAGARTEDMERARARAEQQRLAARAAASGDNRVTGAVGECAGLPTEGYANGQIPPEALCPVWAAPGHRLRADAAFAFSALSQAYAAEFGTPICITDSYRTLSAQVAVRAAKPTLAAVPGTSNHGWGTATDLCGGIQTFGSPQHVWMQQNAPLHGWYHPAWAQQGGSKPEAWHWEYGD